MKLHKGLLSKLFVCSFVLWAMGLQAQAATLSACNEAELRAALSAGGSITFACDGVITLSSTLVVSNDTVLDASGRNVTISGGNAVRVFQVATGVTFTVNHLKVTEGNSTNGAGIYNDGGTVNLYNTTVQSNRAVGVNAEGGGVYNYFGNLNISNTTFLQNVAYLPAIVSNTVYWGGSGSGGGIYNQGGTVAILASRFLENLALGSDGMTNSVGTTRPGNPGAGGAIYNTGVLRVSLTSFTRNNSVGGAGGAGTWIASSNHSIVSAGTNGAPAAGGAIWNSGQAWLYQDFFLGNGAYGGNGGSGYSLGGSAGGAGGDAQGAAVFHTANVLTLLGCTFASNSVLGGAGNLGGYGQCGAFFPIYVPSSPGGQGGAGGNALGAALCADTGTVNLTNNTVASNLSQGGSGGNGGDGCSLYGVRGSASSGGNGGNGGDAYGGTLFLGTVNAFLGNNTIAWNRAIAGTAGTGGAAGHGYPGGEDGSPGAPGQNGLTVGGGVAALSGAINVANTILACNSPTNAFAAIVDRGHNLSSDFSCAFTNSGSLNNTDPRLGPLAYNGGSTPTMALLPGSPALDAADCASSPPTDQRGESRPGGESCDIGAFEGPNVPMQIERLVNGHIRLRFSAGPQTNWTLYSSTNLVYWQAVSTNVVNVNGFYEFENTDTSRGRGRFYKVSLP